MAAAMKERAKAVTVDTFLPTYVKLCKEGKTIQEIADVLGMEKATVSARASSLRKRLAEKGKVLPYPAQGARGAKATVDAELDKVADLLDDIE